jgi:hypothetical protein
MKKIATKNFHANGPLSSRSGYLLPTRTLNYYQTHQLFTVPWLIFLHKINYIIPDAKSGVPVRKTRAIYRIPSAHK